MIFKKGHRFRRNEVAIPVSAIENTVGDVVYLKLDQKSVESLPAIPILRPWEETSVSKVGIMVSIFEDAEAAERALVKLQKMDRRGEIEVLNAAVLVETGDGKTTIRETGDVDPKRGALFGAVVGGLLGLTGSPLGAVIGAVAGATTGGVAADRIDTGFPDDFLQEVQSELISGNSALVNLVKNDRIDETAKTLAEFGGSTTQQTLPDQMVAKLIEKIETQA